MNNLKKIFAVILTFTVLSSMVIVPADASSYKDVYDDKYYAESVEALTLYGIVSGYAGYFDPDAYVTRAELSKMIA